MPEPGTLPWQRDPRLGLAEAETSRIRYEAWGRTTRNPGSSAEAKEET